MSAVLQKNPPAPAYSLVLQPILHISTLSNSDCMILRSIFHMEDNWPTISPVTLSYCCSLRQTNRVVHLLTMTAAVWKPCFTVFLHNFGHRMAIIQMGINYAMEGYIKYYLTPTPSEGLQITIQVEGVSYFGRHDHGWQHAGSALLMYRRVRLTACTVGQKSI